MNYNQNTPPQQMPPPIIVSQHDTDAARSSTNTRSPSLNWKSPVPPEFHGCADPKTNATLSPIMVRGGGYYPGNCQ